MKGRCFPLRGWRGPTPRGCVCPEMGGMGWGAWPGGVHSARCPAGPQPLHGIGCCGQKQQRTPGPGVSSSQAVRKPVRFVLLLAVTASCCGEAAVGSCGAVFWDGQMEWFYGLK